MPLFGKSKASKDDKKKLQQQQQPEPKSQPYKHVPKHAASDARNHGVAAEDRTAQQQRIMAASQSRLNSMKSSYSVKSNFTNVPVNGSSSAAYPSSGVNSPRQPNRASKQAGGAVTPSQTTPSARENYLQQRNPSLVSSSAPTGSIRSASPSLLSPQARKPHKPVFAPDSSTHERPKSQLVVRNPGTQPGLGSADSGYDSVGPSSAVQSRTASESEYSHDVAPNLLTTGTSDFFPKLTLGEELAREPMFTEQSFIGEYSSSARPQSRVSRDRGMSGASNYVSRLDPGADTRSINSVQSRPAAREERVRPRSQLGQQTMAASKQNTSQNAVLEQNQPLSSDEQREDQTFPTPLPNHDSTAVMDGGGMSVAPKNVVEPPSVEQQDKADLQPTNVAAPSQVSTVKDTQEVQCQTEEDKSPITDESTPRQIQEAQTQPQQEVSSAGLKAVDPFQGYDQVNDADGNHDIRQSTSSAITTDTTVLASPTPESQAHNFSRPHQALQTQARTLCSNPTYSPAIEPAARHASQQPPDSHTSPQYPDQSPGSRMNSAEQTSSDRSQDSRLSPDQRDQSYISRIDHAQQPPSQQTLDNRSSSVYPEESFPPSTRATSPSPRRSVAPSDTVDTRHFAKNPLAPPLSTLEGLKVNKRGKILDEEGDPIGELVHGDIIDCVRQRADAFGRVLDDYGRVVGRVSAIVRGGGRSPSPVPTMRTNDLRRQSVAQSNISTGYPPSASELVSPASPWYDRRYPYSEQSDASQQREVEHYRLLPARDVTGTTGTIELDGSGYAEAAPIVDHSDIFMPPFLPPRSPKRQTSDDSTGTAQPFSPQSFARVPSPVQTDPTPGLRKWASRNFEQDHDNKHAFDGFDQGHVQTASAHQPALIQRGGHETPSESPGRTIVEQPKDNQFPWMATSVQEEEKGRWNANLFSYKGERHDSDDDKRTPPASTSDAAMKTQRSQHSTHQASKGGSKPVTRTATKYHSAAPTVARPSAGQVGSRRSFKEHVPHVKSPLSTHNVTPPHTSEGDRTATSTAARRDSTVPVAANAPTPQNNKNYFTHPGRGATSQKGGIGTATEPESPMDAAMLVDIARTKAEKRKSRWSFGFGKSSPATPGPSQGQRLAKKT